MHPSRSILPALVVASVRSLSTAVHTQVPGTCRDLAARFAPKGR